MSLICSVLEKKLIFICSFNANLWIWNKILHTHTHFDRTSSPKLLSSDTAIIESTLSLWHTTLLLLLLLFFTTTTNRYLHPMFIYEAYEGSTNWRSVAPTLVATDCGFQPYITNGVLGENIQRCPPPRPPLSGCSLHSVTKPLPNIVCQALSVLAAAALLGFMTHFGSVC